VRARRERPGDAGGEQPVELGGGHPGEAGRRLPGGVGDVVPQPCQRPLLDRRGELLLQGGDGGVDGLQLDAGQPSQLAAS
jgi:hypothetical protein